MDEEVEVEKYKWRLSIGCWFPMIVLTVIASWIIVAYQNSERKNEYAKKQFTLLCNDDYLLNDENRKKWKKLETDTRSGKLDSRRLSVDTEIYNGKFDHYRSIVGNLSNTNGSDRLFHQKLYVYYDKSILLYFRDLIYIDQRFFPTLLSLDFTPHSCYQKNHKYNEIVNYHFVNSQK